MDHFDDFTAAIDSVELDPRPRWLERVKNIARVECGDSVPGLYAPVLRARLKELGERLREAIEVGALAEGSRWIDQFQTALRAGVMLANQEARAAMVIPEREIARNREGLSAAHYNGAEIDALLKLLKNGEKILEVRVRYICTSTRTIGRGELAALSKPVTWTKAGTWELQFPSEGQIRRWEDDEERERNPRSPWADNRNLDLPRGYQG